MVSFFEDFTTFDSVPISGQISANNPIVPYPKTFMNKLKNDIPDKTPYRMKRPQPNNKYEQADIKTNDMFGFGKGNGDGL